MRPASSQKASEVFADASAPDPSNRSKSGKMLSIRLSDEEFAHLSQSAGKRSLSHYARLKLFNGKDLAPQKRRKRSIMRAKTPSETKALLGQILAVLGASEIAASLRELAKAARLGALPENPETVSAINKACLTLESIHDSLIRALGLRS